MSKSDIPHSCPSCRGSLVVVRLECSVCETEVTGDFNLCPVCSLDGKTRNLYNLFMDARGNLKKVQRSLGVSYPTVRLKIETMFQKLGVDNRPPDPMEILTRLRDGDLSVDEAEKYLKGDIEEL